MDKAVIPKATKNIIATSKIMLNANREAQTIEEVYNTFAFAKAKEITQVIADASLTENPLESASLNINQLRDGLYINQTNTLASTANTASAGAVRLDAYDENNVERVVWVATLDDSVCEDCEALDGTIYDVGTVEAGQEHWNCRCVLEPVR